MVDVDLCEVVHGCPSSYDALVDLEEDSVPCDSYLRGLHSKELDPLMNPGHQSLRRRGHLQGLGLSAGKIEQIIDSVDKVGNLQLLIRRENQEKSDQEFRDWIRTRDSGFLDRHLIPTDPYIWNVESLPEFVEEREKLIRRRIAVEFGGSATAQSSGQDVGEGPSIRV